MPVKNIYLSIWKPNLQLNQARLTEDSFNIIYVTIAQNLVSQSVTVHKLTAITLPMNKWVIIRW